MINTVIEDVDNDNVGSFLRHSAYILITLCYFVIITSTYANQL